MRGRSFKRKGKRLSPSALVFSSKDNLTSANYYGLPGDALLFGLLFALFEFMGRTPDVF